MKKLLTALLLVSVFTFADTPPPGAVKLKGADGTTIGNTGDALKITSSGTVTTSGSVSVTGGSIAVTNFPAVVTTSGTTSVTNFPAVVTTSGTITNFPAIVTVAGTVGVNNFPATVTVAGSLGRTWTLSSGSDSCSSVQSGTWVTDRSWTLDFANDQVNVSGSTITVTGSALPTGAATEAKQDDEIAATVAVYTTLGQPLFTDSTTGSIGQLILGHNQSSGYSSLNLEDDGTLRTKVTSSVLPTNASTESTQLDVLAQVQTLAQALVTDLFSGLSAIVVAGHNDSSTYSSIKVKDDGTVYATLTSGVTVTGFTPTVTVAGTVGVNNFPAVVTTSGTITNFPATVTVAGTVTANAGTNLNTSLLATEASLAKLTQTQGSTTLSQSGPLIQGAVTTDQPTYTTGQTSPLSLTPRGALRTKGVGLDTSQLIRNDYSSTNVTTAAYVQLVASTSSNINRLLIFDSSGQDLKLAVGGAGSEVDQIQIPPGGWETAVELFIPSGSRVSVKAVSATASAGVLLITGLK